MQLTEAVERALVADLLRDSGEARINVTGESMIPALLPGDTLVIRRDALSHLQPGQILLCALPGMLAAHRFLRREGARLVTRGDAVNGPDPLVEPDQALGVVVSALRCGRPVDARLTPARRAAAWLFRRSDLAARIFLRLSCLSQGTPR